MTFKEADTAITAARVRPRNDNLLVRPVPPPKPKSQLIALPDVKYSALEGAWAEVMAVGENVTYGRCCPKCERPYERYEDDIRVGDRVLLNNEHSGDEVILNGVPMRLVRRAECELVDERAPRGNEAEEAA